MVEFVVTVQDEEHIKNKDWFNWSGLHGEDPIDTFSVSVNNKNRVSPREAKWFRLIEPDEHHTNIPKKHLYSFSFANNPEDTEQPSGSLNMSRLDDVSVHFTPQRGLGNCLCKVWTRNFNIFRVVRGLAGTGWSS